MEKCLYLIVILDQDDMDEVLNEALQLAHVQKPSIPRRMNLGPPPSLPPRANIMNTPVRQISPHTPKSIINAVDDRPCSSLNVTVTTSGNIPGVS